MKKDFAKKDYQIVRFDWVKNLSGGNKICDWCVQVQVGVTASGMPDIVGPMNPVQAKEYCGVTFPDALKAIGVDVLERCETAEAAHAQALRDHEATRTELIQARRDHDRTNAEMGKLVHLRDLALVAAETGAEDDHRAFAEALGIGKADAEAARIAALEAELAALKGRAPA